MESVLGDAAADLHVALPGRVESYDATTQTVVVQPMLKRVGRGVDDVREVDTHPAIPDVPVAFPGAGAWFVTFPLAKGDTGLLVFCEADLSPWRATSQNSDPLDDGRHTLAGAVFVPGLRASAGTLPARPDHMVLGKVGGAEIHIDSTTAQVGASGGGFIALASPVASQLSALKSAINGWTPTGGDGGAALKTALTSWLASSSDVAATKAKAT